MLVKGCVKLSSDILPLISDGCEKSFRGSERILCQYWCDKVRKHMHKCNDHCSRTEAIKT